jgi:arginase family enzyme
MVSMETVEINPAIDEHNRTATLGVNWLCPQQEIL